ncbi:hypothetical protein LA080_010554 [Diaporthe eres]|nr:hypothetical protein LA080_010554 [Diaporthe eres]
MAIDILSKSDDTGVDAKAPAKRLMGGMLSPFYHDNHFPGLAARVADISSNIPTNDRRCVSFMIRSESHDRHPAITG